MHWRLGLDLGTNSIGWCALKLSAQHLPEDILASGVRLLTPNQEAGRDPKSKLSLAAERRAARSARRRRDRFLRRQKRLMELLIKQDLMPVEEAERKALEELDPYALRAKALAAPLAPHELGRALFHLNQRRGFKSNRLADAPDDDKGATKEGMRALEAALKEEGAETLGALLAARHAKREPVRFRPTAKGSKNVYDFYPSRDMVEHEIELIWERQKKYHPQLADDVLAKIKRIVIQQRPLKKPPVGRCTFRPAEDRAPRALPLFQRFRILTDLHNLKIEQAGAGSRQLTLAERDALANKHMTKSSTVTFAEMRKALKLDEGTRFNFEGGNRKGFEPDLTAKILDHKDRFNKTWRSLPRARQNEIVERLLTEEDPDELVIWLEEKCNLSESSAERVANARLPQGYAHLGVSVLQELVEVLETDSKEVVDPATGEVYQAPLTYDEAVARLNLHHSDFRPGEQKTRLPYYGDALARHVIAKPDAPEGSQERRGRLPNPTVHIALNQVRKIVNALIDEYGPPYEVVIELARELKWNRERKDNYNKQLAENTKANETRKAKLEDLGYADTGENRLRLKLYEELSPDERVCIYSGKPIACADLFSGAIEIDHILPFSKTLDDSFLNKVLCTREANRKKGNRPPADAFGPAELEDIAERATRILDARKAKKFLPDAMVRFEEAGGWQARHLKDTQHMARTTKEYLGHVCNPDRVWTVPGQMTSMLRGLWGLDKLLPGHNLPEGKNRGDHRHHALDAFVIANLDRALLNKISRAAGEGEVLHAERLFPEGVPEPFENFRTILQKSLDAIIVSHKMDHGPEGQLHEDTAYGLVDEVIDGKHFNLVTRKLVTALTENEIGQIRDPDWRDKLLALVAETKQTKEKLGDALTRFGEANNIRRIRVLKTEAYTITVRHGNAFEKAYVPGGNHRMEIFETPDGKWDFEAVSMFDANNKGFKPAWTKKYSDAKHVMTLHKGDMIEAELGGTRDYWVVYRLNPAGNRIEVAPHIDANTGAERAWQRPSISTLQKAGAKLIKLNPLGRIRAKQDEGKDV